MKKTIFSLLLFAVCGFKSAQAQFSRPLSVGIGAGPTINLTDLANVETNLAGHIDVDGLITPFISAGIHAEKGALSGNGYASTFKNDYYDFNANAKVRIGQFMNLPDNYSYYNLQSDPFHKILANIYLGAGAGVIKNNIKNSIAPNYESAVVAQGGEISQDLDGFQFVVPVNLGVDFPIGRGLYGPQWAINLNYQHTITTKDNLDGVINSKQDHYSYISLGVKYALFQRK
ncbi:outer membrane beta-barrel protein [Sphingobacterium mizutaii]|uniref:outer membrane beta-barrel protein n=1 Tax=Sphingobacterium mizutaii TaxID=1010 RepID=UPI002897CF5A|nr:outer membrane beta-barrel protein [Sphingobacterium mizutaii]